VSDTLLFTSIRNGNYDIYALNVPSISSRRITNSPDYEYNARWLPDGRQIIFNIANRSGTYVINADGTDQQIFSEDSFLDDLLRDEESPDGKKTAFISGTAGQPGNLMVSDEKGTRQLTEAETIDYLWLADSQRIIFVTMSGGGADLEFGIWSIRIDGSNRRKLADTFTHCGPDLSPDGQWIAYENMVNGSPQLFIMRPDGRDMQQITVYGGICPVWQPPTKITGKE
jgi:Tol biopolymer transport system component